MIGSQDQAEEKSDALQLEQEAEHFKRVKFHHHIIFCNEMSGYQQVSIIDLEAVTATKEC